MLFKFRPRMGSLMSGVQSTVLRASQNYKSVLSSEAYLEGEAMLTGLCYHLCLPLLLYTST